MVSENQAEHNTPIPNRRIPQPSIDGFVPPNLIDTSFISQKDASIISKLQEDFYSTGVIERNEVNRTEQNIDELNAIVKEASEHAKSERELNPRYYDEELDSTLQGDLQFEDDWDNPILDGVDDYGRQVFANVSEVNSDFHQKKSSSDSGGALWSGSDINSSTDVVSMQLENGRIIKARIIKDIKHPE